MKPFGKGKHKSVPQEQGDLFGSPIPDKPKLEAPTQQSEPKTRFYVRPLIKIDKESDPNHIYVNAELLDDLDNLETVIKGIEQSELPLVILCSKGEGRQTTKERVLDELKRKLSFYE